MTTDAALRELVSSLLGIYGDLIDSVILYGSVARGTQMDESDVDVAIIMRPGATAELLMKSESYRQSINRSYYAIFHAVCAVNALDGFDSSKHSGVIAHFNQQYVKNGEGLEHEI